MSERQGSPAQLADARALIIGIAGYPSIRPLSPVVLEDARCVHRALTDPRAGGYLPENTRLLLDEQATRAAILAALDELAQSSTRDSTIFLFFSGHGARIEGEAAGAEYLLPFDARFDSAANLIETAISTNEFSAALRAIPAQKLVVALDCCHSGGIGQPKSGVAASPGLSDSGYDSLKRGSRAILASSRSDEYSWILHGDANSLFTRHMLAGLQGGIISQDGLVKIFDLFEYIQPRVTQEAPNQHPVFRAEVEKNFPVTFSLAGNRTPAIIEPPPAANTSEYRYDAYLVFSPGSRPDNTDAAYAWNHLIPYLKAAGVRLAVTGASEEPGVGLVIGVERAMEQSKRTVLVLSNRYLAEDDNLVHFQGALAAGMGVRERQARLLPLIIEPIDRSRLPHWLGTLWPLDLSDAYTGGENLERLAKILKDPVPKS